MVPACDSEVEDLASQVCGGSDLTKVSCSVRCFLIARVTPRPWGVAYPWYKAYGLSMLRKEEVMRVLCGRWVSVRMRISASRGEPGHPGAIWASSWSDDGAVSLRGFRVATERVVPELFS